MLEDFEFEGKARWLCLHQVEKFKGRIEELKRKHANWNPEVEVKKLVLESEAKM